MGKGERALPARLPTTTLHTSSCLTENHSSVHWAMHPAASNKISPSPNPAVGKQTQLWGGWGEPICGPECEGSDNCFSRYLCQERASLAAPGSVTRDKAPAHILGGSVLSYRGGPCAVQISSFPRRKWASEWVFLPACLCVMGGERKKGNRVVRCQITEREKLPWVHN